MKLKRIIIHPGFNNIQLIVYLVIWVIFISLARQLVLGGNGVISYYEKRNELTILQKQLAEAEERREELIVKTNKINPKKIVDADLVDEQYRRATGKIKSNERIMFYDDESVGE